MTYLIVKGSAFRVTSFPALHITMLKLGNMHRTGNNQLSSVNDASFCRSDEFIWNYDHLAKRELL